jgi:hypothetical protein
VNAATVKAFGGDLARRSGKDEWLPPGVNGSPEAIQPVKLISGERLCFTVTAKRPYTDNELFDDINATNDLCAVGGIRYEDGNGVVRETAFFRVFSETAKRFVPSDSDEDEYQD